MRSGREGADVVDGTVGLLDGLAGGSVGPPPKKSNPSNESPCFATFGGAASAFGGGWRDVVGPVVLGRGGADIGSSPKRSIF